MRYRISEVKLNAKAYADREHRMDHLRRALQENLRRKYAGRRRAEAEEWLGQISKIEIIRESIDARKKPDVKAVYTLDFDCPAKLPLPEGAEYGLNTRVKAWEDNIYYVENEKRPENGGIRPVIAGFGPCGMFAALTLAEAGLRPVVLERGQKVEQRTRDVERFWREGAQDPGALDPESNVQFGEGGAGTFSDGKLTTGTRDVRIRKVLETFVQAGADPAILYQQKPHIGTDKLREIIPRIRRRIEALGGEIRFGTKLTGIEREEGRLAAIQVRRPSDGEEDGAYERIPAEALILAIGHSARDTFEMLRELQLPMVQKAFSIGVRIEHPQEVIDAAQYGDPALAEVFGPAVYNLHHRCENGRGVYTFCMCPGGRVINASSEAGGAVTNGMSESGRDSGVANSGLLVDVRPADFDSEDPLAGVEFQRRYERIAWEMGRKQGGEGLPKTVLRSFREDEKDDVKQCLPGFASEAILEAMPHLGRRLKGFDAADAVLTAVESRSSSPVRILRDERMQSGIPGVMPAGEGPGYAGGIMSAAVDGIRAAEQIITMRKEISDDIDRD